MQRTSSSRNNWLNPNYFDELYNFVFLDIETTGPVLDTGSTVTKIAILSRNSVRYSNHSKPAKSGSLALKDFVTTTFCLRNRVVVGHNLRFEPWLKAAQMDNLLIFRL